MKAKYRKFLMAALGHHRPGTALTFSNSIYFRRRNLNIVQLTSAYANKIKQYYQDHSIL